jgi:hypothetical protein
MTQPAITIEQAIAWLDECARYFGKRDTGGEDRAFWSNIYNAENAKAIRDLLQSKR